MERQSGFDEARRHRGGATSMSRSRQIPLCYWSIVGEEGERSSASGMLLSMICALRSHDDENGVAKEHSEGSVGLSRMK